MATLAERIYILNHHGLSHEAAAAVLNVTVEDVLNVLEDPESETPESSSGLPDGGNPGDVVVNTAPGQGEWSALLPAEAGTEPAVAAVRFSGEFPAGAFASEAMTASDDPTMISDPQVFEVVAGELQVKRAGIYQFFVHLEETSTPVSNLPLDLALATGFQLSGGDWMVAGSYSVFQATTLPTAQSGSQRLIFGQNQGVVATIPADSFNSASVRPTLMRAGVADENGNPLSGIFASLVAIRLTDAPVTLQGTAGP